jgi:hypothetical protein
MQTRSRGASSASELCRMTTTKIRCASRARSRTAASDFRTRSRTRKREAERRKAHCPTNVRAKRGCAPLSLLSSASCRRGSGRGHAAFRRSRLRHSPPASTPMAQPRNRVSRGFGWRVLPASPDDAAVKHAPCRPILLPVDRGSRAARVRLASRPRAPRLALVFTACLPERRPQQSEMVQYN